MRGGLLRIVVALVKAIPAVGQALFQSFIQGMNNAFKALAKKILLPAPEWLNKLKIPTPPWLKKLLSALGLGGDGETWLDKTKSFIGRIADVGNFKFQSGGVVPKGFPNDTYPAALSSGELVVPKDTTSSLFNAIDRLGSTDGSLNQGMMAQILAAVTAPITVQTTAEVNNQAFADIILTLNRQNARLA